MPVNYKLPPEEFDLSEAYKDTPEDFATARTIVARPLDAPTNPTPSEPLPIVPVEISKKTTVEQLEYTPAPRLPEPPVFLALGSGALFGLAMLLTLFPIQYERLIALPLLLLGLIVGILATLSFEPLRKKYGFAAIAVNAVGLLLVVFLPSWLRLGSWLPEPDPNAGVKPALSVPHDGGPPTPADWVNPRLAMWQQDDVRIELQSARNELADPMKKSATAPRVLRMTLKLSNVGVARTIVLNGWPAESPPKLTVNGGPAVPFIKVETPLPKELHGGGTKDCEIVLAFEVPPALTDVLLLELPAVGVSTTEPVRFRIPVEMIPKPEKPR